MKKILEIACFNLESAILAQASGANRIELCENYKEGGITPNQKIIIQARQKISIPLHVIVRPRGGNFIYSDSELNEIRKSILFCRENKIDGIVFGVLNNNFEVDKIICAELIALAKPMKATFHRAIDECISLKTEIQKLIDLGFNAVLSSGDKNSVLEGVAALSELQKLFGTKITIIPGGGLRSTNLHKIMNLTHCDEFHSSAITKKLEMADENEIKALKKVLTQFS